MLLFLRSVPHVFPCGYFSGLRRECSCTPLEIQKHLNKVSGPLLDRIDIHIQVAAVRKEELLRSAISELRLSARACHKVLKISRTIADLEEKETIDSSHISEALQYRYLDRDLWRR